MSHPFLQLGLLKLVAYPAPVHLYVLLKDDGGKLHNEGGGEKGN